MGVRGNALTHDVELGRSTLEGLLKLNEGSASELKVPRYDKSAYKGKGDRADKADWPVIKAPLDVILFEGWMLGFTPVSDEAARQVQHNLMVTNKERNAPTHAHNIAQPWTWRAKQMWLKGL